MRRIVTTICLLFIVLSIVGVPIISASELYSYMSEVDSQTPEVHSEEEDSIDNDNTEDISELTSAQSEGLEEAEDLEEASSSIQSEISTGSNLVDDNEETESESDLTAESERSSLNSEPDSETNDLSDIIKNGKRATIDYGDAPGYAQSQIAIDAWNDKSSAPAFFLGFDRASFDIDNLRQEMNGLGDDITASSMSAPNNFYDPYSTDDETGFVYKSQENDGTIVFSKNGPINLTVPYENTRDYSGNILLWIDFDGDHVYETSEGVMKSIRPGDSIGSYNPPDGENYYNSYGVYNYFRNSEELTIIPPAGTVDNTYMRVVLTNDSSVGLNDGNLLTYPGVGEIEEYPVRFYNTSSTCNVADTINNPKMEYTQLIENEQEIDYLGVLNPTDGVRFDMKIKMEDPGSKNNTRLDATRDYPLENYGSRNEGILVTPQIIYNNYSGSAKVTISTTYAGTSTPYPVPLQLTINDMDGDNGSREYIENISDMESYKMESDSNVFVSSDKRRVEYTGQNIVTGSDGFYKEDFNAVSAQKFTYTTSNSSVHTFDVGRTSVYAFGEFPIQISFPSNIPSNCINGDTVIGKDIINESNATDGILDENEEITYQVKVKNNTNYPANNVHVRDSLLESLPAGMSLVGGVNISPATATSGSLTNGTFVINQISVGGEVTITYTLKYTSGIPEGTTLKNIVTDNGMQPANQNCTPSTGYKDNIDCSELQVGTGATQDQFVNIDKSIISQTIANDNNFTSNEEVTYQIAIKNTSSSKTATNIRVRDSLLADLPNELELVRAISVSPTNIKYTGSLLEDNFYITSLAPNSEVNITYTLKYVSGLSDGYRVTNVATDNGSDPTNISSCAPSNGFKENVDCEQLSIVNLNSATIDKSVTDRGNEVAESGEYLYYTVTETTTYDGIHLVDTFDSNIDPNSIVVTSVTENNVPLNASNYSYTISGNTLVIDLPASTVIPGSTYQINYTAKIVSNPETPTNGRVMNTVVDTVPDNKPTDSASLPALYTNDETLTKTVVDESEDGYAQAGEKLIYSIEYHPTKTHELIVITDYLTDQNLTGIVSNLRVYEDDQLLNPPRYSVNGSDTIVINDINANTDYTIIFDAYVVDEPNLASSVVKNVATEELSGISNGATITLDPTPIVEKASITKDAQISTVIGEDNGDNIANPGEYVHYDINYQSNKSKVLTLVDISDENLDTSSLTNVSLSIDGVEQNSSAYNTTIEAENNLIIFSEIDYPKNTELQLSYDLMVMDPSVDSGETTIENIIVDIDNEVSDDAVIDYDPNLPSNTKEVLEKSVVGSTKVSPGDTIQYRLAIEDLSNNYSTIEMHDVLENEYLQFVSIDGVYIDGLATSSYTNGSSTAVDLTVNHDFNRGDKLEVYFSAKLRDDTPKNITIGNQASGSCDTTATTQDSAYVATGNIDISDVGNIYTDKKIVSEAGGGIDNQVEINENITYEIEVKNLDENPVSVLVKDDFASQSLENIYEWNDDDLVEVISEDGGVISDTTIAKLQSGITLNLAGYETQFVRFRLRAKDAFTELDINPADGDPDLMLLNTAEVTVSGKSSLYPGVEIGLPHMNGELSIAKHVTTKSGNNVITNDSGEFMRYTITIINHGVNKAEDVFVRDDLEGQYFDKIVDLDEISAQKLILSSASGGTFVTPNPTIADLTSSEGVEVSIPAGDFVEFEFMLLPRKGLDFNNIDLNDDGILDDQLINTAIATDKTTNAKYSASSAISFETSTFDKISYTYTDENNFGELIPGFDMMNDIELVTAEATDSLVGYIAYDNRYLNDIRPDSFEVYVNDTLTNVTPNLEYIKQGNTTTAMFEINYPIASGDNIQIFCYQPPKDALYDNTSMAYSINDIRLVAGSDRSDVYYSAFRLN